MDPALKILPILISLGALAVSLYTFWNTKRELKKSAERQFLEVSSTTVHHILADLRICLATDHLALINVVNSEAYNELLSQKQSVLRFRTAPWYADFEAVLEAMANIASACGEITMEMRAKNLTVANKQLLAPIRGPVVEATNAIANYVTIASDRLSTL